MLANRQQFTQKTELKFTKSKISKTSKRKLKHFNIMYASAESADD